MSSGQGNKDVLVVYYSRSGNTEEVANYLAQELGADILQIKAAQLNKWFKARKYAARNMEPEIIHDDVILESYDLILLWICKFIWPDDKPPQKKRPRRGDESNWIILDHLERDGRLKNREPDTDDHEYDGDYDGPDW